MNVMEQTVAWQDFGLFLRKLRQRRGISQENLALMLGCHRTYTWRLEHGRNCPSSIFLHNLKLTCDLAPAQVVIFKLFEQLR